MIVAGVHLFDTCTNRCSYCHYAETGKVLDHAQVAPYRDPAFIDRLLRFFVEGAGAGHRWELVLTGGEPLLMPNLDRFTAGLFAAGNVVSFNTALNIAGTNDNFQLLLHTDPAHVEHVFASLHPDSDAGEDGFFERVGQLKAAGHAVIVRFICHPARLGRLEGLRARCEALDVAFSPSGMISPTYPGAYSAGERATIESHISSIAQLVQLRGGLSTRALSCWAGSRLVHIDVRTGAVSHCSTVQGVIIGNVYDDRLELLTGPGPCPRAGQIACNCNLFFQTDMIVGAEDSAYFERQQRGYAAPVPVAELEAGIHPPNVIEPAFMNMGQVSTSDQLLLAPGLVRDAFRRNADYLADGYREPFHREFTSRMGDGAA